MPRAVLKNGVILPVEPLPADWSDGTDLSVQKIASRSTDPAKTQTDGVQQPKGKSILKSFDAIWAAGMNDWENLDDPDGYFQEVRGDE